jgi:hypothetical protein
LFDASLCGIVYDALGHALTALAMRSGYPVTVATSLAFSLEEKAILSPLTATVAAKWWPDSGKYSDELALAVAFASIMTAKVMVLRKPGTVTALHVVPAPESPIA